MLKSPRALMTGLLRVTLSASLGMCGKRVMGKC